MFALSNLERVAQEHAGRGIPVISLIPGKNIPLHAGSYEENAMLDPEAIAEEWRLYPEANIGILQGQPSGIVTVDIDCKDGKPGYESLGWWEGVFGPLPETETILTPSGGRHFRYRTSEPVIHTIDFIPGIDILSTHHYAATYPSVTERGRYELINDHPIVELPESLVKGVFFKNATKTGRRAAGWVSTQTGRPVFSCPDVSVDFSPYTQKSLKTAFRLIRDAAPKTWNWVTFWEAYRLGQQVGAGLLTYELARSTLMRACAERGHCGKASDIREAERVIDGSLRAGMKNPWAPWNLTVTDVAMELRGRIVDAVWALPGLSVRHRLVAACMGNHVNEEGTCQISLTAVAKETGISRPNVSVAASDLQEAGIGYEVGVWGCRGGRAPKFLNFANLVSTLPRTCIDPLPPLEPTPPA
jgi:hypothetical protein